MKFTKREKFTALLTVIERAGCDMNTTPEGVNPEDYMEMLAQFCVDEIALLDRKHNAGPNPKREAETREVHAKISAALANGEALTATEIANATGYTVQRVSANVKNMLRVERVADGKRTKFRLT